MQADKKKKAYAEISQRIDALLEGETDLIAMMATVVCELHQHIDYFHWTGFYRVTSAEQLTVGPYQGGHGCLRIPFSKGICGRAARTLSTVIIDDVNLHTDHIACSSSTISEIVVPLLDQQGRLLAVLDVDCDFANAFDTVDQQYLELFCETISMCLPNDRIAC